MTPFNRPSPRGAVGRSSPCRLDDIKKVKHAFETSLNDVVLAICAHALRRYLDNAANCRMIR